MKKFLLVSSILLTLSAATQAAQVSPTPSTEVDHSSNTTGSAVTVLAAGSSTAGYRTDCTLINNGLHNMYYSFTGIATTSSKPLAPGSIMNCTNGTVVDMQALSLLGTASDAYSLTESFVGAQ